MKKATPNCDVEMEEEEQEKKGMAEELERFLPPVQTTA